jgi:putative two-component system response regulator
MRRFLAMRDEPVGKADVLVVDDDPQILGVLRRILAGAGYAVTPASDVDEALAFLAGGSFDLLLCDVELPDGSGLDVVEFALSRSPHIAAFMVSGIDDVALADRAIAIGAFGYLVKPFTANDVLRSVLSAVSRRRRDLDAEDELRASREETVQRLCIAVEARDAETAAHISEMSRCSGEIALELGLDPGRCELIRTASVMHDVGKLGIPDHVLLKPGALSVAERAIMEQHAEIGYRILAGSTSELLQLAATIAWTHHEKPDGTGYPRGLRGPAIPFEGRIAAAADVYDALTRDRVYRRRFSSRDALGMLEEGRGTHLDPDVLDALHAVVRRTPSAR